MTPTPNYAPSIRYMKRASSKDTAFCAISGTGEPGGAREPGRDRLRAKPRETRRTDASRAIGYIWNRAMAAGTSHKAKTTANGHLCAALTATYSRMKAVGQ